MHNNNIESADYRMEAGGLLDSLDTVQLVHSYNLPPELQPHPQLTAAAAIDGDQQQLQLGPAAAGDDAGEQLQLYHPAGELQQPAIIAFKQPPVLCAHLALLHNRQENTMRIFAYSYIHSYS